MAKRLEAPLTGNSVTELQDWASLWGDLFHVDMVLHARDALPPTAGNVFARRGLWEGAVIAYGRTAISGRRQKQIVELLAMLGPEAEKCHAEVMAWRHQHAAHRVDVAREKTEVQAMLDPQRRRIERVGIRVAPVLGPEEEERGLGGRFGKQVKDLKDLIWTQRIQPLEKQLIKENSGDFDVLLKVAKPPAAPAPDGFSIDINPSGNHT